MASQEMTVWYFYKVRWGFQEEFLRLFRQNHYPVLKAQLGDRFTAIRAFEPKFHGDGRADWTFAVSLTFKDAAMAVMPSQEQEIARRLFPDQERFKADERRRFELLDAHWDAPLKEVELEGGRG
jgi:hypothetical protein